MRWRVIALLGVALAAAGLLTGPALGANAIVSQRQATTELHLPPVAAVVVDPFRPPAVRWGAGNRGLEYDTDRGDPVRASAAGVVTFAGQVGGTLHVTVRHGPTLVTTVSFVDEIHVGVGQAVLQGDRLATAGEVNLHFSARVNGAYIDPMLLFERPSYAVRLVRAHR